MTIGIRPENADFAIFAPMFKKLLPALAMLVVSPIFAQGIEFEKGNKQSFWLSSADFTDCHIPFFNKTGSTASLVYNKVSVDWPSQWDVSFCDDLNCFTGFAQSDTFMPLANNGEAEFKITVTPNGHGDTGVIKYEIYSAANPNVRDTVEINIFVPWSASFPRFSTSGISVYPNPGAGVYAFQSVSAGIAYVVDLKGTTMYKSTAVAGENTMDLTSLPAGVYWFELRTSEGILREALVKQ